MVLATVQYCVGVVDRLNGNVVLRFWGGEKGRR